MQTLKSRKLGSRSTP